VIRPPALGRASSGMDRRAPIVKLATRKTRCRCRCRGIRRRGAGGDDESLTLTGRFGTPRTRYNDVRSNAPKDNDALVYLHHILLLAIRIPSRAHPPWCIRLLLIPISHNCFSLTSDMADDYRARVASVVAATAVAIACGSNVRSCKKSQTRALTEHLFT